MSFHRFQRFSARMRAEKAKLPALNQDYSVNSGSDQTVCAAKTGAQQNAQKTHHTQVTGLLVALPIVTVTGTAGPGAGRVRDLNVDLHCSLHQTGSD